MRVSLFSQAPYRPVVRRHAPLANWIEAAPTELPQMLFHDPEVAAAKAMLTPPEAPDAAIVMQSGLGESQAR